MMCSTASIQVCLDAGETDQVLRPWHTSHTHTGGAVRQLTRADGRPTGWASSRLADTLITCPPFTLPLEPSNDPANQWAQMAMEAPVICIRRDGPSWGCTIRADLLRR